MHTTNPIHLAFARCRPHIPTVLDTHVEGAPVIPEKTTAKERTYNTHTTPTPSSVSVNLYTRQNRCLWRTKSRTCTPIHTKDPKSTRTARMRRCTLMCGAICPSAETTTSSDAVPQIVINPHRNTRGHGVRLRTPPPAAVSSATNPSARLNQGGWSIGTPAERPEDPGVRERTPRESCIADLDMSLLDREFKLSLFLAEHTSTSGRDCMLGGSRSDIAQGQQFPTCCDLPGRVGSITNESMTLARVLGDESSCLRWHPSCSDHRRLQPPSRCRY
jgi:hypothetical protein